MLQLLLGNIGRPGGGLNALRGHANIQGGTDCGMAYHNLPGYIPMPKADHATLDDVPDGGHAEAAAPERRRTSGRTPIASSSASSRRTTARRDHARTTSATPSIRGCRRAPAGGYENWSWAYIFDRMYRGDMEGFFSFGMNPVSNGPHSRKAIAALSKLKWLVVAENFEQETAAFWRDDILALVDKKPEDVQTEVFLLPAANFAEKDGIVRQLGALDSVEVEGGRSARRGEARSGDHRAHLPRGARALREGRRHASRIRFAA